MRIRWSPIPYPPDPPRSGLHLSSIIKYILTSMDKERYGKPIDHRARGMFEMGYSWEDYLSLRGSWSDYRIIKQPPQLLDGITGTPDAVDTRTPSHIIKEGKATWLKLTTLLDPRFRHWHWQSMGYCKMVGTEFCDFDVLYVNGDYRGRIATGRHYSIAYRQREINENWAMVLTYADEVRRLQRRTLRLSIRRAE